MARKVFREDWTSCPDNGKSTGPQSSTSENSGGPVKTLIVPVLRSSKKIPVGSLSMGILVSKKIRSYKSFGGPVKLRFFHVVSGYQSSGPTKVQKFSRCLCVYRCQMLVKQHRIRLSCHSWPLWEELVLVGPANERPVTNHIHDLHMMNIQSMITNNRNSDRSTATSLLSNLPFPLENT